MERLGKVWKGLERLGGMEDWGKGKFGLENGCFGAGKLVPGRPKWVLGPPNWRQNGSRAAKIGAWRVPGPPKLDLGRSGRRFGGLGARLDGHLGGPRAGLDAILGPLGRPGRRFWVDFGGIWGSQTGPKEQFSGSEVEKCKIAKSSIFHWFFDDFGGLGALEIDQNGVKWLSKSVRDGWWTQNMHLGG